MSASERNMTRPKVFRSSLRSFSVRLLLFRKRGGPLSSTKVLKFTGKRCSLKITDETLRIERDVDIRTDATVIRISLRSRLVQNLPKRTDVDTGLPLVKSARPFGLIVLYRFAYLYHADSHTESS
jgi:hypothetical protein